MLSTIIVVNAVLFVVCVSSCLYVFCVFVFLFVCLSTGLDVFALVSN